MDDKFKGNRKARENLIKLTGNITEYDHRMQEVAFRIASELSNIGEYDPIEMHAILESEGNLFRGGDINKNNLAMRNASNRLAGQILGDRNANIDSLRKKYSDFIKRTSEIYPEILTAGVDYHQYITDFFKIALTKEKISPNSPNWPMVAAWFKMDLSRDYGTPEDVRSNNDFIDGYIESRKELLEDSKYNIGTDKLDPKKKEDRAEYFRNIGYMADNKDRLSTKRKDWDYSHEEIASSLGRVGLGKNPVKPKSELEDSISTDEKQSEPKKE